MIRVAVPTLLGRRVYEVNAKDTTIAKYKALKAAEREGFSSRKIRTEAMLDCAIVGKNYRGINFPDMTPTLRNLLKRWVWLQGCCMTSEEFALCFRVLVKEITEEMFKQLAASFILNRK